MHMTSNVNDILHNKAPVRLRLSRSKFGLQMADWRITMFEAVALPLGVIRSLFSFDTPLSHVMLIDRTLESRDATDLEKQIRPAEFLYATRKDDLFTAAGKLWEQEGWRGFCKGSLAQCFVLVAPLCSNLILNFLTQNLTARRNTGWRWFINYFLYRSASNLILSYISCPAKIIRTRLRLSPNSRSTREEFRYLWLKTTTSEWFSSAIVAPTFLRHCAYDLVYGLTALLKLPTDPFAMLTADASSIRAFVFESEVRSAVRSLLGGVLSFPLLRCQRLAAVTEKPMEISTIPIAEYKGLADEIVRDSAWNGFKAYIQLSALHVVLKVPYSLAIYYGTSK